MKNKITILITVLLVMAVYCISGHRSAPNKTNDFRDAVADERSPDFTTAVPVIAKDNAEIPAPSAPQRQKISMVKSAQNGVSKPFIAVEMKSSAVAGRTPNETRSNVAAFFGKSGLKIMSYQDNDAYSNVQLDFREPAGLFDTAQLAWAKSRILGEIKGLPEVKELRTVNMEGKSFYRVMFSGDGLYSRSIRELFSKYPDLIITLPPKNSAMTGTVWVRLSVENMNKAQAKAAAAKLKAQFPNIISSSEVKISVTMMEVTTR